MVKNPGFVGVSALGEVGEGHERPSLPRKKQEKTTTTKNVFSMELTKASVHTRKP